MAYGDAGSRADSMVNGGIGELSTSVTSNLKFLDLLDCYVPLSRFAKAVVLIF